MVTLTISPRRGNHARYFPHSGYLGLTPVVVTGVVETRLEEDNQPVEASRLIVRIRCYEAIGSSVSKGIRPEQQQSSSSSYPTVNSGLSSNVNVLWQTEKTLWTAASNHHGADNMNPQYDPLGDWKGSWKLTIPVNAVSHSDPPADSNNNSASNHQNHLDVAQRSSCAVGSITYKSWRSWWQVETVLYHKPAGVLGTRIMKSHGLYLVNYGEAQKHYSRSIEESRTSIQSTTRMSNRNLRYSITAPSSACCGDEVELIIRIRSSSSTLHHFGHRHEDQTKTAHYPQLGRQYHARSPEPIQGQGRVKDFADSDITLKRLQVSLVRRLAIELVKSPLSNNNNSHSLHQTEDTQALRIGQSTNPTTLPPSIISPMMNHNLNIGASSSIQNNSKILLTSFNTVTTSTESKSFNLNNNNSSSQHDQDGYDVGFIVKLKIPIVKSKSHYSIGETFKTDSTIANFFFQFKVQFKFPLVLIFHLENENTPVIMRQIYDIILAKKLILHLFFFLKQFKKLSIKNKLTNRIELIDLSDLSVQVFSISKDQIKSALDQLNKSNSSNNLNNHNALVYQDCLLLNPPPSSSKINKNINDSDDI